MGLRKIESQFCMFIKKLIESFANVERVIPLIRLGKGDFEYFT